MRSGTDHPNFGIGRARRDQFAHFSDEAQNARIQQVVQERGIALAQTVHSRDKGNPIFSYQSDVYTAGAIAAELLWNILGDGGKVSIFTTQKDLPFYAAGIRGFRDAMQRYPAGSSGHLRKL